MTALWLVNVASGTTEDEIKTLIETHAPELRCAAIQIEEGDGSRPAAFVACPGAKRDTLDKVCARLCGMFWKGRALVCTTTQA
jgi:hypothetical protein